MKGLYSVREVMWNSAGRAFFVSVLTALFLAWCGAGYAAGAGSGVKDGHIMEADSLQGKWEIRVPAGAWREYIYTNKEASHFSGESVRRHSRSYHGLFCAMHEYLDSWELRLNGELLDADAATGAAAYPHTMYRLYGKQDITEEIFLPDERNELIVRFSGVPQGEHELIPWVDMRYIWDTPKPEYRIFWEKKNNVLLISRVDNPFPKGRPRWLAVTANVPLDFTAQETFRPTRYPKDAARRAMGETFPFSPGRLAFTYGGDPAEPLTFVFVLGRTDNEAAKRAEQYAGKFGQTVERLKRAKLDRIDKLLEQVPIPDRGEEFQKAMRWALVSMDNLIMNQRGKGIYAGFFWFPNYWGRDSFISLPGACLSTKRYDVSRAIIMSFVEYQQTDPASARLGRFPNIVNPDNLQYAGVDGTWWLVRAAWKHVITTGDPKVLFGAFPQIRLAIEGALEKAVDGYGYLTHGDGETWMDAGGEANPYSPRGNRAVEVQALFHHGLLAGAAWARTLASLPGNASTGTQAGAVPDWIDPDELLSLAGKWEEQAAVLCENFRNDFRDEQSHYLFDHLNADGSPDHQIRPNAVLALWVSLDAKDLAARRVERDDHTSLDTAAPEKWDELIPMEQASAIVETAMKTVVLRQGVTSLDPKDPNFHPYHLNLAQYYYDAAYHNGDVWEWLTGPMVTCMRAVGEDEAAEKLIAPLVDEILNRACVGSLREIQDGVYTEGKEEFGGATSQAWSLAEFIRVCLEEERTR